MKATLVIKNIDNLITLKGKDEARSGKDQGEIGLMENGVLAVAGDKIRRPR